MIRSVAGEESGAEADSHEEQRGGRRRAGPTAGAPAGVGAMIALVVTVTEEGERGPEQFAFIKSPVRIGRGELNDLPLRQPFVSTYHGLVQFDEREARYVDLGSLNGSALDGVPLEKNAPAMLGPGAEIWIGTYRLAFARRSAAEKLAVAPRMTAFALQAASSAATPAVASRGGEAATPAPAERGAAAAAVEAAEVELDLHYASYRGAWQHLLSAMEDTLARLDGPARGAALARLAARYDAVAVEPQFVALGGGAPAPGRAEGGLGGEALRLLRAFADSYLPDPKLATAEQAEGTLGRAASVLETFARSFLELQRGYEEFGREMGVRTVQGEGAIHRARDARQLLAYVLDPRAQARELELQRAFADFMIHQVALLRGVVEGAQALLARLSPEAISASAPRSLWPLRAQTMWKAYEERFHEIADEDSAVSEVLFGREFARAYAAMAGQQATRGAGDDADDEGEGEPGGS